jgi:GNAT superfamily N-acetyltransferase
MWDAMWQRDLPGVTDVAIAQLSDRYRLEEAAVDLRYLAVRRGDAVVACCLLKIDGATAVLDALHTEPEHRRRGHADALLTRALALAADAGCDLAVLTAAAEEWPREWYARRGFREVGESWSADSGG